MIFYDFHQNAWKPIKSGGKSWKSIEKVEISWGNLGCEHCPELEKSIFHDFGTPQKSKKSIPGPSDAMIGYPRSPAASRAAAELVSIVARVSRSR